MSEKTGETAGQSLDAIRAQAQALFCEIEALKKKADTEFLSLVALKGSAENDSGLIAASRQKLDETQKICEEITRFRNLAEEHVKAAEAFRNKADRRLSQWQQRQKRNGRI